MVLKSFLSALETTFLANTWPQPAWDRENALACVLLLSQKHAQFSRYPCKVMVGEDEGKESQGERDTKSDNMDKFHRELNRKR